MHIKLRFKKQMDKFFSNKAWNFYINLKLKIVMMYIYDIQNEFTYPFFLIHLFFLFTKAKRKSCSRIFVQVYLKIFIQSFFRS